MTVNREMLLTRKFFHLASNRGKVESTFDKLLALIDETSHPKVFFLVIKARTNPSIKWVYNSFFLITKACRICR